MCNVANIKKKSLNTTKVVGDTKINIKVKYNPLCDYEAIPDRLKNIKQKIAPVGIP